MMRKTVCCVLTALLFTAYLSCKKAFNPHLTTVSANFLAVDGPIISGDSTFISLSRTTGLNDTTQNKAELKAIVSVEDDQNKLYPLTETGKGMYVLGVTNFSTARQYRLDIKTTDGKIYQSDFVQLKVTPQIDSLYFKQNSDATVLFYADTHDATNNTRYYRWDYKETWEYHSFYGDISDTLAYIYYNSVSGGNFQNGGLSAQNPPLYTGVCYATDKSNEIVVGTSAKLANDIIKQQQIGGVAAGSQKISVLYNMQLNQYALTEAGFNYYQNLKTNTEETGSIFDATPSVTTGNIHCITSPTDRVIGFISASTITTRMLPIHYSDIPLKVASSILDPSIFPSDFPDYVGAPNQLQCEATPIYWYPPPPSVPVFIKVKFGGVILTNPVGTFPQRLNQLLAGGFYMITNTAYTTSSVTTTSNGLIPANTPIKTNVPIGYYYFERDCTDCRAMPSKGTLIRPSYLPPY